MRILIFSAATMALVMGVSAQPEQNAKAPTGEFPAAWNVGAIGIGHSEGGKAPKTTAPNGRAIQIGEEGEAGVAYDLDLCRVVGAGTGKATPPKAPSADEQATSVKDIVFATGGVAGF